MARIYILIFILGLGSLQAYASTGGQLKGQVIEDVNEYSQNDCINCQVSRGPAITSSSPDLRSANDLDQKMEKIAEPLLIKVEAESAHSSDSKTKRKGRGPAVLP